MTLSVTTSLHLQAFLLAPEASAAVRTGDAVDDELLVAFDMGHLREPLAVGSLWDPGVAPPPSGIADEGFRPEVQEEVSSMDSMSEVGEMETLRLQMAMERLSKVVGTLSNLLHKVEETQSAITQDIK